MQKEELKNWTREQMKQKILSLNSSEEVLKKEAVRMTKCISSRDKKIDVLNTENEELRAENKELKQRIKDLEDVCDGSCFSDYEDLPYGDEPEEKDRLIAELQYQHQQDCIRINDLTTTVHVLAGLYSAIRKNVGMD